MPRTGQTAALTKSAQGGQVSFDGRILDSAGTYDRLIRSTAAGDSVEYFTVVIDSVNKSLQFAQFGGEFISLQDSATYQWISCSNDSVLVGDTSQTFIPTENGSYAVIITNSTGCSDISECITIANVSLQEEPVVSGLSLYPNPVKDQLVLKATKSFPGEHFEVQIYHLSGKLVYAKTFDNYTEDKVAIDIQALAPGIYLLKLGDELLRFAKE